MPETSMNIDGYFVFGNGNIWFPRQRLIINPKSYTMAVQVLPYNKLGLSVARFDPAHIVTSGFRTMHISHFVSLPIRPPIIKVFTHGSVLMVIAQG